MYATLIRKSPEGSISIATDSKWIDSSLEGLLAIPEEYSTGWEDWTIGWMYCNTKDGYLDFI